MVVFVDLLSSPEYVSVSEGSVSICVCVFVCSHCVYVHLCLCESVMAFHEYVSVFCMSLKGF